VSLTTRRAERSYDALRARLDVLARIGEIGSAAPGRLPGDVVRGLSDTVGRARARLGHGSGETVVALAGATGSGKSSLFNAVSGRAIADVGVRRPTTSVAQAAVFDPAGDVADATSGLLDWLVVQRRHVVDGDLGRDLFGLVLLDLPDHDSTATEHRTEVDRLVEVVDAFVWVVDPQKYADLALHEHYLRPFATHATVTLVVLNQIDRVPDGARRGLVADLARLLREDGLQDARIIMTSTATGEGVRDLVRELAERVAERRAAVARLLADVAAWHEPLRAWAGERDPQPVDAESRRDLGRAFAAAAGADAVAEAVGAAHRHRAIAVVGWPPTRWLRRFRPDPLRRLGLDRAAPPEGTTVARTSRPGPSAVAAAAATTAARSLVERATAGLPPHWQRRVADVAAERRGDVADALDRAIASAVLPTTRPRWWTAVAAVQKVLAAAMLVGLLWLLALGVAGWFRLPDVPTPHVGEVPWPTALALGGALAGVLLSVASRFAAGVGARRRVQRARRTLEAATADTADRLVIGPVDAELRTLGELRRLVRSVGEGRADR
jgi:GTP-binding protein EngB required for normal cell division